jgi:xanthine dehydrogenase accessory factor
VCFVGSRRKFDAISSKLLAEDPGLSENLKKVKAPAGLRINAITPDEIALSILAEITQLRRAGALSRENADV